MAGRIKLGNRPKTFKEIQVSITLPDGEEGLIPVTYKYKTKQEFGAWQDSVIGKAKNEIRPEFDTISWQEVYAASGARAIDNLLEIIDSWGLDVPLNQKSLQELEDDCGAGVFPALFEAFGRACRDGRLGN